MKMYKGFTVLETLLVMCLISVTLPFLYPMMQQVKTLATIPRINDDQVVLHQLRIDVAMSKTVDVIDQKLQLTLNHKKFIVTFKNDKLFKTPGHEIYIEKIEDAYFYKNDGYYYLHYERGNKEYEVLLGK